MRLCIWSDQIRADLDGCSLHFLAQICRNSRKWDANCVSATCCYCLLMLLFGPQINQLDLVSVSVVELQPSSESLVSHRNIVPLYEDANGNNLILFRGFIWGKRDDKTKDTQTDRQTLKSAG